MVYNKTSNLFCETLIRAIGKENNPSLLDGNNVVWQLVDGKWMGKRSVWTFDFKACWLEETTVDNVKSWWCGGKNADYTEIFYRDEQLTLKSANQ
jgi:hypothetical protein